MSTLGGLDELNIAGLTTRLNEAAAAERDAEADNCIDSQGRAFTARGLAFATAHAFRSVASSVAELQAALHEDAR